MKAKEISIKCNCGSEILHIEKYDSEPEYYISIWERGYNCNYKLTFKDRLKHAWYILSKGKLYNDQMIISSKDMESILGFYKSTLSTQKPKQLLKG